jgi:hypothetical protein
MSRFLNWARRGEPAYAELVVGAANLFVSELEPAGFVWTEVDSLGTGPEHSVKLERVRAEGETDFVLFVFDKYRRAQFQALLGTKRSAPPHAWVRAGALVWKKQSEDIKFKWWGARWWQLDKLAALEAAVVQVHRLLPQAVDFLSGGPPGSSIWTSVIGAAQRG